MYFFVMNAYWNYMFFLNARAVYTDRRFAKQSESIDLEKNLDMINDKMRFDKTFTSVKRFIGYQFNGSFYLDNPGAQAFVERKIAEIWRKNNWI